MNWIKKLYQKVYRYFWPETPPKKPVHKVTEAICDIQRALDTIQRVLRAELFRWDRSFYVTIKHIRKKHTFDLRNPTTTHEYTRKKEQVEQLLNLVFKRCLQRKAYRPFKIDDDDSFDEIIAYFLGPDPVEKQLVTPKGAKPQPVQVSQEQIDSWKRLRAIYFKEKGK